jgi:hypothetical protein
VMLAVVPLPWYLAASAARGGAVLRSQILAENFVQFSGIDGRANELFYLRPWLLDSFPWNVLAVAALSEAWRRRDPGPTFCAVWWISSLAFFQIAAYKRRAYLLPALPAEALLAGWFTDVVLLRGRSFASIDLFALLRRLVRPVLVCLTIGSLGALVAVSFARLWAGAGGPLPLDAGLLLGGSAAIALAALALARALRAADRGRALVAVCTGLGFLYAIVVPAGIAVVAQRRSTKLLVDRIEAALPEGSRLTLCGIDADTSLPVVFYFRDSDRLDASRDGAACTRDAPAGFYLVAGSEWLRMRRNGDEPTAWHELLRGELMGWSRHLGVVFAERVVSGDLVGAPRLAEK